MENKILLDSKYLVVSTSILPDYIKQVVLARDIVESGEANISKACEKAGVSRSTYYKYKDNVFRPDREYGKKSIFAFKMADEKGVLSKILSVINDFDANVIAINQAMPIKNYAYVTITLDISDTSRTLAELTKSLKQIKHVKSANLIAFE